MYTVTVHQSCVLRGAGPGGAVRGRWRGRRLRLCQTLSYRITKAPHAAPKKRSFEFRCLAGPHQKPPAHRQSRYLLARLWQ